MSDLLPTRLVNACRKDKTLLSLESRKFKVRDSLAGFNRYRCNLYNME